MPESREQLLANALIAARDALVDGYIRKTKPQLFSEIETALSAVHSENTATYPADCCGGKCLMRCKPGSNSSAEVTPLGWVWPDMVDWIKTTKVSGGVVNLHREQEDPSMVPVYLRSAKTPTSELTELARHVLESEGDPDPVKVLRMAARVWDLVQPTDSGTNATPRRK